MTRPLRSALATALCLSLAAPAMAQGFKAENRVRVNPMPNGAFEVIEGGGFGARGMWCAASDYARSVLGASGTTRIYVQEPRGDARTAPGRKGVVFGLEPTAGQRRPVFITAVSIRTPGANLTVDHAWQFCADYRLINNR